MVDLSQINGLAPASPLSLEKVGLAYRTLDRHQCIGQSCPVVANQPQFIKFSKTQLKSSEEVNVIAF